jgi:hypothetical protein
MLAFGTDLAHVKTVYLLKMSKGMEQYLANRLANEHLFQIVTDPKLADAIWTDQIGEGFEAKLNELFPPPAPPEPEEKDEPAAKPEKGAKTAKGVDSNSTMAMFTDAANKLPSLAANSSFGHSFWSTPNRKRSYGRRMILPKMQLPTKWIAQPTIL